MLQGRIGTVTTTGKTGARGWRDAGDCSSDTMLQAATTAAASAMATGVQETPAGSQDGMNCGATRRPKRRRGASS